jgi:hypothetical protein
VEEREPTLFRLEPLLAEYSLIRREYQTA